MANTDYKQVIIDSLKAMQAIERKSADPNKAFKIRAYGKVIKQITDTPSPITSMEDVSHVTGIGDRIKTKLEKIFAEGFLNVAQPEIMNIEERAAVDELSQIMSIGPVKARELYEKFKVRTTAELKERLGKDIPNSALNEKQHIGLKYSEDFLKRIPRKEMERHKEFLATIFGTYFDMDIAGSFRRGAKDSGDIDVLLRPKSHSDDAFKECIQALKDKKYLHEDFAFGEEKYMGTAKLPRFKTHRRIDILLIPADKYAAALLYFTGSQEFNINMRKVALEQGYSLSEHGIKYAKGAHKGEFIKQVFRDEKDIFDFLKIPYVAPEKR